MNDIESAITIANLTQDNINVLNYFENNQTAKELLLKELYDAKQISNNNYPLINQSVFLSAGYISFVWLYEIIAKREKKENEINKFIANSAIFGKTNDNLLLPSKNRDTKDPSQYLRTLRNSISHGIIKINFDTVDFIFEDHNTKKRYETDAAMLKLSMASFGKLSEDLLHEYNHIVLKNKVKV